MNSRSLDLKQQILDRISIDLKTGCWKWTGTILNCGYGQIQIHKAKYVAHRLSYELFISPIPKGLQIDHLCRNRRCVNPAHLEPVTCQENLLRGNTWAARNAAKTHCINGHEFTAENIYFSPEGWRYCRRCRLQWCRDYERKQREFSSRSAAA